MEDINWDESPEDAIGAGLMGQSKIFVWVGDTWYEYTSDNRAEPARRFKFQEFSDSSLSFSKSALSSYVERPVEWSGDGLPPIGTVCEAWYDDSKECWHKAQVLSYHPNDSSVAAVRLIGKHEDKLIWQNSFRPIKTKEQLEEEVKAQGRERVIEDIARVISSKVSDKRAAESLYELGYRKMEKTND